MFLTFKTIDIFHTQTIDVPTLEAGIGVVTPYIHMPPYVWMPPCVSECPHTSVCPHVHLYVSRGYLDMIWGWGRSIQPVLSTWMIIC